MKHRERQRVWFRLDNAGKIFPASLRTGWSNVFRLSVSFRERVDEEALKRAVERVVLRFPSICVSLKRGLFWYYLEENATAPALRKEGCQPLLPMNRKEIGRCAVRILSYENRIAVEFFHALTDGTGGMIFLKNLAAVYLEEKKGLSYAYEGDFLNPDQEPQAEELEDAFLRYEGDFSAKRRTSRAYSLLGIPERDGFLHDTCMTVSTAALCRLSKEKEVTVTGLLSSALIRAIATIQNERVDPSLHRPVRVQIPANLRKPFPSKTVRNFVAVVNVGLEKGELDADMEEILLRVRHQMALFLHPRNLRAVFTTNVKSEKGWGIRLVPLFLKNIVMRAVFDRVGEAGACLCLSNLGRIDFPEPLKQEVERVDFIIGPQCKAPYNCAVASFGEWTRIHVVRNSCEPVLEKRLYEVLTALGLEVTLESNGRD